LESFAVEELGSEEGPALEVGWELAARDESDREAGDRNAPPDLPIWTAEALGEPAREAMGEGIGETALASPTVETECGLMISATAGSSPSRSAMKESPEDSVSEP